MSQDAHAPYEAFNIAQSDKGLARELKPMGQTYWGRTTYKGEEYINFSSNNYLGIAQHPLLTERATAWSEGWGAGAMASRLVCGTLELHEQVEQRLLEGKGGEAALIFNSGFQANSAILATLLDKDILGAEPLVFCDRLNHASMHAGLKGAGVRQIRYRHNDLNHLEELLIKHRDEKRPRFIITESVFSMDGDRSDIDGLMALADTYAAQLYVDEAHATGILGEGGFGLCAQKNVTFKMGTFSKALGGFGAYLVCPKVVKDYLINKCAGLIYSTALPPSVLGAMDAALELVPQLDEEREHLLKTGAKVRQSFMDSGFDVGQSTTQIIPLIVGEEDQTLKVSQALEEEKILGVAIRPPTVPRGTSRIRLALNANHRKEDVQKLCDVVANFGAREF